MRMKVAETSVVVDLSTTTTAVTHVRTLALPHRHSEIGRSLMFRSVANLAANGAGALGQR